MKAVVAMAPGGTEQLVYGEHAEPAVGAEDVLVRIKAASLNHADIWLRQGQLGPLPLIPGIDGAGIVAAVGSAVPNIAVDARVVLNPVVSCGHCEQCLVGDHGTCPQRQALGQNLNGTYAEYVAVPWQNILPIADKIGFDEAAAIPSAFFTAWQTLIVRAALQPGETVLVIAAASGVGSAAVQIARMTGAYVIGTASNETKLAHIRQFGADDVINHSTESVAERVRELTRGRGCDVILDTVGAGMWPEYEQAIGRNGRIVLCSFTTGDRIEVNIRQMMGYRLSILGSGPQGSKPQAAKVMDLVNRGRLHGVVDRVFALSDAAAAQAAMESRDVIGKLILRP